MDRQLLIITLLTLIILLSKINPVSSADLTGARPLAMGGAFVGVADDVNSVLWNPAGMKQSNENYLGVNYRLDQENGEVMGNILGNILLVYSRPNNNEERHLDNGLGISRDLEVINGIKYKRGSYVFALADQYTRNIAIGVSGKYVTETGDISGYRDNFTLDAGLLINLGKIFKIGIVGYNLTDPSLNSFSRKVQGGAEIRLFDFIKLAGDGAKLYSDNIISSDINYNLGIEFSIAKAFSLRGGYSEEKIYDNRYASGGIGWKILNNTIIIEYTYYNRLNGKVDNRHILALTFASGG